MDILVQPTNEICHNQFALGVNTVFRGFPSHLHLLPFGDLIEEVIYRVK